MDYEIETQILFSRYGIMGYSGSVGSPDTTIYSIGTTPVDIVRSEQMGDDVDLRRF